MSDIEQTVVLVSSLREEHDWLQGALEGTANVVLCQQRDLNDVLQLMNLAASSIVFVPVRSQSWMQDVQFIEGLVAARPTLACIAVSDIQDQERLLGAMRAGARDFVTFSARGSELSGLVRRLLERTPAIIESPMRQGSMVVLASERPALQAGFHALHLAAAIARHAPDAKVLLLDLGQPFAETQLLYGLEGQFSFPDTLRNLRRLDRNLVETAFPRHSSGVSVLSTPMEGMDFSDITTSEMFLLVGTLRSIFTHVIVNICGLPTIAVTELLIGNANQVVVVVDQSITSCRAGLNFMSHLKEIGCPVTEPLLLVDHYQPKIAPDSSAIMRSFGFKQSIELLAEPELRLRTMNLGQLVFDVAPQDPLSKRYLSWAESYGAVSRSTGQKSGTGLMGLFKTQARS